MVKLSAIETLIQNLDEKELKNYSEKLHENLKDLNAKESKYTFWLILAILLFFISRTNALFKINFGLIDIEEKETILKILPLIIAYILFNLGVIGKHKKNITHSLNLILNSTLKLNPNFGLKNRMKNQYLIDLCLPYSLSSSLNHVPKLYNPSKKEVLIGFILVLPIIFVAFIPYFVVINLIYRIWFNGLSNFMSFICFYGSIWILLLIPFYVFMMSKNENFI